MVAPRVQAGCLEVNGQELDLRHRRAQRWRGRGSEVPDRPGRVSLGVETPVPSGEPAPHHSYPRLSRFASCCWAERTIPKASLRWRRSRSRQVTGREMVVWPLTGTRLSDLMVQPAVRHQFERVAEVRRRALVDHPRVRGGGDPAVGRQRHRARLQRVHPGQLHHSGDRTLDVKGVAVLALPLQHEPPEEPERWLHPQRLGAEVADQPGSGGRGRHAADLTGQPRISAQVAHVVEDRRLQHRLAVRLGRPRSEVLPPLVHGQAPAGVRRHHVARTARPAALHQDLSDPVGQPGEPVAEVGLGEHERMILIGRERLLFASGGTEHDPRVRRGRRSQLALRPATQPGGALHHPVRSPPGRSRPRTHLVLPTSPAPWGYGAPPRPPRPGSSAGRCQPQGRPGWSSPAGPGQWWTPLPPPCLVRRRPAGGGCRGSPSRAAPRTRRPPRAVCAPASSSRRGPAGGGRDRRPAPGYAGRGRSRCR